MENNIIDFSGAEVTIRGMREEVNKLTKIVEDFELEKRQIKTAIITAEEAVLSAEKKEKSKLKDEKSKLVAKSKTNEIELNLARSNLENLQRDLAKLTHEKFKVEVSLASGDAAEKVFTENNIHYVITDQQWWSVDPAGGRMDIRISSSETPVIKDMIFYESDIIIEREQELKSIAKKLGRMYKHIVRDFVTRPRAGIYNQMDTIRKQWLVPIYDKTPHESFRILMLSIAGGSEEYADQLERFIAYRYCHPEDIMVPNIDSCGVGGTGRDTYFNMIATIFTNECVSSVAEETFRGTHNGELFGKMMVKVDEKNSSMVPIDKLKELTGSSRYRHREMNKNAREVDRLFSFIMFRNGFTTTVRLAGTGSSGEDRRWEPMLARVNLNRHAAVHFDLIPDINIQTTIDQEAAVQVLIKDWQRDYYKNEERIAEWLGYAIQKYDAKNMSELLPIHGSYYKEMLERQKKGIDGFMPKFMELFTKGTSTVIGLTGAHKLYEAAESVKVSKDWFRNAISYWLNSKAGWDVEMAIDNVYTWDGCTNSDRTPMPILRNRLSSPTRIQFDINDFIDSEALDEKGTTVGEKINVFSIRDQLR
jgi:hypothetical protein